MLRVNLELNMVNRFDLYLGFCGFFFSGLVLAGGFPPGMFPNQVEAITIYHETKDLAEHEQVHYQEFCDRAAQRMGALIKHARIISYNCPDAEQGTYGWIGPGGKWKIGGKIHFFLLLDQLIQRVPVTFTVPVVHGSYYSMHYYEEAYEQEFNKWAERPDFVFLIWKGESSDSDEGLDKVPAKAEAWLTR